MTRELSQPLVHALTFVGLTTVIACEDPAPATWIPPSERTQTPTASSSATTATAVAPPAEIPEDALVEVRVRPLAPGAASEPFAMMPTALRTPLLACYAEGLATAADLEGKARVRARVNANGPAKVTSVKTKGVTALEPCIRTAIAGKGDRLTAGRLMAPHVDADIEISVTFRRIPQVTATEPPRSARVFYTVRVSGEQAEGADAALDSQEVLRCYGGLLQRDRHAHGELVLVATLETDGRIKAIDGVGDNALAPAAGCIKRALQGQQLTLERRAATAVVTLKLLP